MRVLRKVRKFKSSGYRAAVVVQHATETLLSLNLPCTSEVAGPPEHVIGYEWEQTINKDSTTHMVAFGLDENALAIGLLTLADQHRLILRVFDRCVHGTLYRDGTVKAIAQRAFTQYKELLVKEGFTDEVPNVGDVW